MADKVTFKISCPRCDSALSIISTTELNYCVSCGFPVQVSDQEGLLAKYKAGEIADLKFVEHVLKGVKDKNGKSGRALELVFKSELLQDTVHDLDPDELDAMNLKRLEEEAEKARNFDNKTAHTQVIELSFDPAAYFEQGLADKKSGERAEKKISLNQVIEDQNKQSKYKRSTDGVSRMITLAILFTVLACLIIVGVVYFAMK